MPFASPGPLRVTGRKAVNALRHNHNANGHGNGSTGNRALHIPANPSSTPGGHTINNIFSTTLAHIHPRNPSHKLFSSSRNLLARFFNSLTGPGFRVSPNIPNSLNNVGSRSFHLTGKSSIQSSLSLPVRYAIRSKTFGAGTFLPRSPAPIRGPVATQMGLGTARNFSSSRPIFQNLVDNVPIAVRALYEADLDVELNGGRKKGLNRVFNVKKSKTAKTAKGGRGVGPKVKKLTSQVEDSEVINPSDIEKYFSTPHAAVTTYLLIPLAPTPTNRVPLSALDLPDDSTPLTDRHPLLSLHGIGALHVSHSTHALRVSTIFARLDQANVWSRGGVLCSAYSEHARKVTRPGEQEDIEGVCTVLKVEFTGWTKAEVRSVIGECGTGWCILEEVHHGEDMETGMLSAAEDEDSLASDYTSSSRFPSPPSSSHFDMGMRTPDIDPSQTFVLPTLDFSSSFLASTSRNAFSFNDTRRPTDADAFSDYDDPWMDDIGPASESSSMWASPMSLSRSSSSSSFVSASDVESNRSTGRGLIIDPPSENSWFGFSSRFYDAAGMFSNIEQSEPRERVFE